LLFFARIGSRSRRYAPCWRIPGAKYSAAAKSTKRKCNRMPKGWKLWNFQIAKSGHKQPTATPQESLPHHRSSYKVQRATTQPQQQQGKTHTHTS
jgi:hypothetical protein